MQDLLVRTVNYNCQFEATHQLSLMPEARFKNTFVDLDVQLAKLADLMGWFAPVADRTPTDREQLLAQYVRILRGTLLVANLRNWNRSVALADDELQRLAKRTPQLDYAKLYLATKNMLYAAYFKHSQSDFAHALKLILKLGLGDLGFEQAEVEAELDRQLHFTPLGEND